MFQCNGLSGSLFSPEKVIALAKACGVMLSGKVYRRICAHNPGGCVERKKLGEPLVLSGDDRAILTIEAAPEAMRGFIVTVRFSANSCMRALRLLTFLVDDDSMFDLDRKTVQLSVSLTEDSARPWTPTSFSLEAAMLFLLANAKKR